MCKRKSVFSSTIVLLRVGSSRETVDRAINQIRCGKREVNMSFFTQVTSSLLSSRRAASVRWHESACWQVIPSEPVRPGALLLYPQWPHSDAITAGDNTHMLVTQICRVENCLLTHEVKMKRVQQLILLLVSWIFTKLDHDRNHGDVGQLFRWLWWC